MKLPDVADPPHYQGLYVFDFGAWTAVGYTAQEIAVLLESEAYRGGKVYKIVRAWPDGRMELRGVAPERFLAESGMFFYRRELAEARLDYDALVERAGRETPPCRAFVQLADRGRGTEGPRYVTALVYPAEFEDEIAAWLGAGGYAGGDTVEGGISHASNYRTESKQILDRQQLWSHSAIPSRSADEVLRDVRRAVQR